MSQSDIIRKADRFGRAAIRERLISPQMVQKMKAVRHPSSYGIVNIFEVQSSASGWGIYTCYEQKLVAANWGSTDGSDKLADKNSDEIEVMNLDENDPVSAYYWPALCKFDRLLAWQMKDDAETDRWVGIPIGPPVRLVKACENAPHTIVGSDTGTITCNVLLNDYDEAEAGELGHNIEVKGRAAPGSIGIYWDETVPLITGSQTKGIGTWLRASCIHGHWYFEDTFIRACIGDGVVCLE